MINEQPHYAQNSSGLTAAINRVKPYMQHVVFSSKSRVEVAECKSIIHQGGATNINGPYRCNRTKLVKNYFVTNWHQW